MVWSIHKVTNWFYKALSSAIFVMESNIRARERNAFNIGKLKFVNYVEIL